jgi:hypothetical protein
MNPLYLKSDFDNATPKEIFPLKCKQCNKIFYRTKHTIQIFLNKGIEKNGNFCSNNCSAIYKLPKKQNVKCMNCNKTFLKRQSQINKTKNNFCSCSCAATFNNSHKTTGNRRSKLEIWIEGQLNIIFPTLYIDYNKTSAINSELDIYIPSLKLAFELNGIFHYEPIYGNKKLTQTQQNDMSKSKKCHDNHIDLCIIDTSHQKYFKESTSQQYINIIVKIIKERMLN